MGGSSADQRLDFGKMGYGYFLKCHLLAWNLQKIAFFFFSFSEDCMCASYWDLWFCFCVLLGFFSAVSITEEDAWFELPAAMRSSLVVTATTRQWYKKIGFFTKKFGFLHQRFELFCFLSSGSLISFGFLSDGIKSMLKNPSDPHELCRYDVQQVSMAPFFFWIDLG